MMILLTPYTDQPLTCSESCQTTRTAAIDGLNKESLTKSHIIVAVSESVWQDTKSPLLHNYVVRILCAYFWYSV